MRENDLKEADEMKKSAKIIEVLGPSIWTFQGPGCQTGADKGVGSVK